MRSRAMAAGRDGQGRGKAGIDAAGRHPGEVWTYRGQMP